MILPGPTLVSLLMLCALTDCFSTVNLPHPQIQVVTNKEFRFRSNRKGNNITALPDGGYKIPSGISSIVLVCTATYPLTWKFHNAHFIQHGAWMLSVRTRRTAGNIYDHSTYNYTAMVNVYGNYERLTGNYTCSHTAQAHLQSSVYIFWHADSRRNFIQKNESLTVYAEDNMAILPCISSDPNFRAPLVNKMVGSATEQLFYNSSVTFDARRGVILKNVPAITGNYTCLPHGTYISSEFVSVQVKDIKEKVRDPTPTSKSNASITYDSKKSKIQCCSSSGRSPVIEHRYCNHPSMCEFMKKYVAPDIFNSFSRKRSRHHCSTIKLYVHGSGLVHCVGDGIDIYKQYVFGLRDWSRNISKENYPVFFNWAEINPHDMMVVRLGSRVLSRSRYNIMKPRDGTDANSTTIYHGQWLSVYCYTSEYMFSEGLRWGIKWKNNTLQIKDTAVPHSNFRYEFKNNVLRVKAHEDMEAIHCIAPIWNSTEYIHKLYPVYVNASEKPFINETLEEQYTWRLNDTGMEISCSAFGIPIPNISWKKVDDWWHPSHINLNHTQSVDALKNITEERIQFERVTYTTNGTYICTASNFGGSVQRKIHIFVEEPSSWKKGVAAVVGVVLSLFLLAGILILLWRLRSEKQVIRQLSTSVTFKDGSIRPDPAEPFEPLPAMIPVNSTEYINSTLDPNKLTANLLQ